MLGFFKKIIIKVGYLKRWHLIPKNPFFNIYLHKFTGNDQKYPHCHPWNNLSIILKGSLREYYVSPLSEVPDALKHLNACQNVRMLTRGDFVFRKAELVHRLELVDGHAWTLFVTFRRRRCWGFYTPTGFAHHEEALDENGKLRL